MKVNELKNTVKYYKRKKTPPITAIQLNFDVPKDQKVMFKYEKWGATQQCKPGDWLAKNGDEVYTIDAESFKKTYTKVEGDLYEKTVGVYATKAKEDGSINTKEGTTHYKTGDWIVYNDEGLTDGYAISDTKMRSMYDVR